MKPNPAELAKFEAFKQDIQAAILTLREDRPKDQSLTFWAGRLSGIDTAAALVAKYSHAPVPDLSGAVRSSCGITPQSHLNKLPWPVVVNPFTSEMREATAAEADQYARDQVKQLVVLTKPNEDDKPAAIVTAIGQGRNRGKQVYMLRDLPNGTQLFTGRPTVNANFVDELMSLNRDLAAQLVELQKGQSK